MIKKGLMEELKKLQSRLIEYLISDSFVMFKILRWYCQSTFKTSSEKKTEDGETHPWISGRMYSALQPIRKSKPGNTPIDVLFRICEIPSPPKQVESFHFHPVAFKWKLCPIPTCIVTITNPHLEYLYFLLHFCCITFDVKLINLT